MATAPLGSVGANNPGTGGKVAIGPGVPVNDPVRQAVLKSFAMKNIKPSSDADVQYWVDHINATGGFGDAGNQSYWLNRMMAPQGGVGDYLERPEAGSQSQAGAVGNNGAAMAGVAPQLVPLTGADMSGGGKYPLASVGGGGLMMPWTTPFNAPTDVTEQNDPGFAFRMQQGIDALQRSAAARGGLFNGETAKDLMRYGQDYGSNEYANVYGRAQGEYSQAYNIFENNQNKQFNRLASLAGIGQTAAGQLGQYGSNLAGVGANAMTTGAAGYGNYMTQAANANAAGQVGAANAWSTALGNIGNSVGDVLSRNYASTYGH